MILKYKNPYTMILKSTCITVSIFLTFPDQTKNEKDLKFGTHPPQDQILKLFLRK